MRTIDFPAGATWVDWWNSSLTFQGGSTVDYLCSLENYPAFKRAGAIIPLDVEYDGRYPFNSPKQPLTFEINGLPSGEEVQTTLIRGLDRQNLTIYSSSSSKAGGRQLTFKLELSRRLGRFARRSFIVKITSAEPLTDLPQQISLARGREDAVVVVSSVSSGNFFETDLFDARWSLSKDSRTLMTFIPAEALQPTSDSNRPFVSLVIDF